jgi:hypothetical protein
LCLSVYGGGCILLIVGDDPAIRGSDGPAIVGCVAAIAGCGVFIVGPADVC